MVWQLLVLPGAQTVTETKGVLTLAKLAPEGPAATVITATLDAVGGGGGIVVPEPPPPPHAARTLSTASGASAISLRITPSLLKFGDGNILRQKRGNISPPGIQT